jgi:flagella basal body P-ring formation protein FlgA
LHNPKDNAGVDATMTANNERFRGRAPVALAGILTLAAGALTFGAAAQLKRWQPPETIAAAARAAAVAAGAGEVEAVAVDARLKLAECGGPLDATIQRPVQRGSGTIAVSCGAPTPWRLFVPVRATNPVAVLVLARNVQAGETLAANDIAVEHRPSASLPYDYLSEPDRAVGSTLRRAHPKGAVVVPAALEQPEVVMRGAIVTLIAGDDPVTVKSDGVALEGARLGQRLRVRSASGRIVEGTAEGPGQVRMGT